MSKHALPIARLNQRLLTVSAAADFLDLSEKTIRRRIDDGKLPALRIGNRIRIREDDLHGYMNRCRTVGSGVRVSP